MRDGEPVAIGDQVLVVDRQQVSVPRSGADRRERRGRRSSRCTVDRRLPRAGDLEAALCVRGRETGPPDEIADGRRAMAAKYGGRASQALRRAGACGPGARSASRAYVNCRLAARPAADDGVTSASIMVKARRIESSVMRARARGAKFLARQRPMLAERPLDHPTARFVNGGPARAGDGSRPACGERAVRSSCSIQRMSARGTKCQVGRRNGCAGSGRPRKPARGRLRRAVPHAKAQAPTSPPRTPAPGQRPGTYRPPGRRRPDRPSMRWFCNLAAAIAAFMIG